MPPARTGTRTPRKRKPFRPLPDPCLQRLLGGDSAAAFLRQFWQKEALLVRAAVPDFTDVLRRSDLFALAARDDVESRLVHRIGRRWTLAHGPFPARALNALPERDWSLLVQGVNLHVPAGDALLRRFSFIPYARLDDLMVSYAAPGGGVGPHLDAYDVFLLQGTGRRRWRYGRQADNTLRRGAPLKLLRRFMPTHDDVLQPGDMLYLPPEYAHDGVALDPCTTYSIGFKAPGATELAIAFLDYLRDEIALPGRYTDPDLAPTSEPARVDSTMLRKARQMLRAVRWNEKTIARFMGTWLSEPKPTVIFNAPDAPFGAAAFRRAGERDGVDLDACSQLLYDDTMVFINGREFEWPLGSRKAIARLGNERRLAHDVMAKINAVTAALLHDWYRDGYLHLGA